MTDQILIPHFVADRPVSLRILSGLDLANCKIKIGLMAQANTSKPFRRAISMFPCFDRDYCGVVDGPCMYNGNLKICDKGKKLKESITTIADSGVFTKQGGVIDYIELFHRYEEMGIVRGIMLDALGDKEETIRSGEKAIELYQSRNWNFKLVGVAQGKDEKEYIDCYEKLINIGFEEIAVGGLLKKRENTVRFVFTENNKISRIVKAIKSEWPEDRCFTLGVYNPRRHELLESLRVDAADYKGWIFQYKRHYEDPISHQKDRFRQTRNFIEKNILLKQGGPETAFSSEIKYKESNTGLIVIGERVYTDSTINQNIPNKRIKLQYITVVSCGKSKSKKSKCAAKDAYIGRGFILKRRFAELNGYPWFILSAKYGLMKPNRIIEPNYDEIIRSKHDMKIASQKIGKQLRKYPEFTNSSEILFLGPRSYAESLRNALPVRHRSKLMHLTKGLKQGESQKAIKNLIDNIKIEEYSGQLVTGLMGEES